MSFLDEAKACEKGHYQVCTVRKVLRQMTQQMQAEVLETLRLSSDDVTGEAIAAALKARGYEIDAQNVQRHRRGACKCPDEFR